MGASYQARGGVARHDGIAWGFARAASMLGVDIIQDCEVIDIEVEEGRVKGVKTTKGEIMADRIGCVSAGHSSVLQKWPVLDCQLRVILYKHLFLKQ